MSNEYRPPKILKKFNLSVDGVGFLGLAEEITLPKLTVKTKLAEVGFQAPIELDIGQLEPLQGSVTLSEYNPNILKQFGGLRSQTITMVMRGAIQANMQDPKAVKVTIDGYFKQVDFGSWKDGETSKMVLQYTATKYQLEIDKEKIYHIDMANNKRIVGGVDQIGYLRNAVGATG